MQFNTTKGHLMKRELTNVRLKVIYNTCISISVYIMTVNLFSWRKLGHSEKTIVLSQGRGVMVFNVTFNNIIVLLWRSVLLVEDTGKNHWPVTSHWQTFITYCCIEYISPSAGFKQMTLMLIDTDCTGSCKSNYNMITTTTAPSCHKERGI
jgi:hypothetical protein